MPKKVIYSLSPSESYPLDILERVVLQKSNIANGRVELLKRNIESFENKSVFYHISNTNIYKDKVVTIAGGGDSALDWAVILAKKIAKKVYIIHRRNNFRAAPKAVEEIENLSKNGNIELVTPYQLHKITGENGILESIEVINLDGNTKTIKSDYLLPFFGMSMNNRTS